MTLSDKQADTKRRTAIGKILTSKLSPLGKLEAIDALLSQVERDGRLSELEMFKKIEVMDMSKPVVEHISRRTKQLQSLEPGRE